MNSDAKHLAAQIQGAFRERQWPQALDLVEEWCRRFPSHAQGRYWQAGCLMNLGRLDEALAYSEVARQLAPDDAQIKTLTTGIEQRLRRRATRSAKPGRRPASTLKPSQLSPAAGPAPAPQPPPPEQPPEQPPAESLQEPPTPPRLPQPTPEEAQPVATTQPPSIEPPPPVEPPPPLLPDRPLPTPVPEPVRPKQETLPFPPAETEQPEEVSEPDEAPPQIIEQTTPSPSPAKTTSSATTTDQGSIVASSGRRRPGAASRSFRLPKITPSAGLVVLAVFAAVAIVIYQQKAELELQFHAPEVHLRRRLMFQSVVAPHPDIVMTTICDGGKTDEYLEAFSHPNRDAKAWESAKRCLEVISDPATVPVLLDHLRTGRERWGRGYLQIMTRSRGASSDILSVLVRMKDSTNSALSDGIDDPDPTVRDMAITALAYRKSLRSISVLQERCLNLDPAIRKAVSTVLAEIAASGQLDQHEAFELFQTLAQDSEDEVRLQVATDITIFQGTAAIRLCESLVADPSRPVNLAAIKSLRILEER